MTLTGHSAAMDNPSADTENFLDSTPERERSMCERATKGVRHESMFDFSGDRGGTTWWSSRNSAAWRATTSTACASSCGDHRKDTEPKDFPHRVGDEIDDIRRMNEGFHADRLACGSGRSDGPRLMSGNSALVRIRPPDGKYDDSAIKERRRANG